MNGKFGFAAALVLSVALGGLACGGSGDALGLKHRVSDKELVGLDTEATLRLEAQRAEVAKLEDTLALSDSELKGIDAHLKSSGQQTEEAKRAIDAAGDKISATTGAEEKELEAARAKHAQRQAELKQRFEEETRQIRDRYAKEQEKNRAVLATAKGGKAVADAQQNLHKAELEEGRARQAVRRQEVRVAKARYELARLEEALKITGVIGPEQQARKLQFEQQLAEEEKQLAAAQANLAKREEESKLSRGRLEQERARAGGGR